MTRLTQEQRAHLLMSLRTQVFEGHRLARLADLHPDKSLRDAYRADAKVASELHELIESGRFVEVRS